ncbi:MAG: hypothetical protein ACO3C6_06425 [Steroidobacteraceae bacterium]
MNSSRGLAVPVIVVLTVLALGWLLLGDRLEEWSVSISLLAVALALGWSFAVGGLLAVMTGKHKGNDAAPLALLGPDFFLNLLVIGLTLLALLLAIAGASKLAFALDIVAAAVTAIGVLLVLGKTKEVATHTTTTEAPRSAHLDWYQQVQVLGPLATDPAMRSALVDLAEQCRYAASDTAEGAPQNGDIGRAIGELANLVTASPEELMAGITRIKRLLSLRDVHLRTARSKA